MSVYELNFRHSREVLIFCFHLKQTLAETHRMLSSTYGEAALSERTCCRRFQRFKNGDFDVEDLHGGGKEKISKDSELGILLAEDLCQTQAISKRLKAMEIIQKQRNWIQNELKPRDVKRRSFIVNSCFKDRIGRGFYIAL